MGQPFFNATVSQPVFFSEASAAVSGGFGAIWPEWDLTDPLASRPTRHRAENGYLDWLGLAWPIFARDYEGKLAGAGRRPACWIAWRRNERI